MESNKSAMQTHRESVDASVPERSQWLWIIHCKASIQCPTKGKIRYKIMSGGWKCRKYPHAVYKSTVVLVTLTQIDAENYNTFLLLLNKEYLKKKKGPQYLAYKIWNREGK